MRKITAVIYGIGLLFVSSFDSAVATDFLRKGYILNDSGKKCWYKQTEKLKSRFFHGKKLTANTLKLTFDKPNCMKDTEFGDEINVRQINSIITKFYSHSDAKFQISKSELKDGSLFQQKGKCIQSANYPLVGVAVFYHKVAKSVAAVSHSMAAGGCNK